MSRITASALVPVQHPTGLELTTHLAFEKKPTRLQMKRNTLQKYVEKYPTGWKKRLELAHILYSLGLWEQAVEHYRCVLERQPHLLDVRLKLAKILQIFSQPEEAIALYQDALASTPETTATYHHIQGLLDECHNRDANAAQAYQQAAELEPANTAHWFALAHVYQRQDAIVDAITAFDRILAVQPEHVSAQNQSADLLWHIGAYAESMDRTEKVLAIAPDHASALKRWFDHRCRTGVFQGDEGTQTINALKKLQKLSPHAPETYQSQAYYYRYQGKIESGKALLKQYCTEHPKNPFGLCYYAQFLIHIGDMSEAIHVIEQAYQLYPDHMGICQVLCEIVSRTQLSPTLKRYVDQILGRFSTQWSMLLSISKLFVADSQMRDLGRQLAETVLQPSPQMAEPWFFYGQILQSDHDYSRAIEVMTAGWQRLPTQWCCATSMSAAIRIAQCHDALGNDDQAQRWWHEGVTRSHHLRPFFPALAHYWQGTAYMGLMQWSKASHHFQVALKWQLPHTLASECYAALSAIAKPDLTAA